MRIEIPHALAANPRWPAGGERFDWVDRVSIELTTACSPNYSISRGKAART